MIDASVSLYFVNTGTTFIDPFDMDVQSAKLQTSEGKEYDIDLQHVGTRRVVDSSDNATDGLIGVGDGGEGARIPPKVPFAGMASDDYSVPSINQIQYSYSEYSHPTSIVLGTDYGVLALDVTDVPMGVPNLSGSDVPARAFSAWLLALGRETDRYSVKFLACVDDQRDANYYLAFTVTSKDKFDAQPLPDIGSQFELYLSDGVIVASQKVPRVEYLAGGPWNDAVVGPLQSISLSLPLGFYRGVGLELPGSPEPVGQYIFVESASGSLAAYRLECSPGGS